MRACINPIDAKKVAELLLPGGPLSLLVKNYECRSQQTKMLQDVSSAYNNGQIAIIEAGTGVGKSMAYLIPAILWSAANKERTLISTNTISLQEQLVKKDIPLASKIAGFPIKAVIVKGMSNYLCLRKLEEAKQQSRLFSEKEKEELEIIQDWSESAKEGSLTEIGISPSYSTWEKVCVEGDTCTQRKCPFFKKCFFFNARKEAEDAQLLISNHSMLFADLSFLENNEDKKEATGLLPPYSRVILDEAHNIESAAIEFFADKAIYLSLLRWLAKLSGEKTGKLSQLNQKLLFHYKEKAPSEIDTMNMKLSIDLPGMQKELLFEIASCFEAMDLFLQEELGTLQKSYEKKLRLLPKHFASPIWKEEVLPKANNMVANLFRFLSSIRAITTDLSDLKETKLDEQTSSLRQEILAYCNRLEDAGSKLKTMLEHKEDFSKVLWMESKQLRSLSNILLVRADLDISHQLSKSLFKKFSTIILCSATLSTDNHFTFIKKRLGLAEEALLEKRIVEKVYTSPFNYQKQSLLIIPKDMPSPTDPKFFDAACEKIWLSLQACKGNAFLLFTSYGMLTKCYNTLFSKLKENRYSVFKQGDTSRSLLLENYKKGKQSVLFGTDSFWEGVDVPGEALRCVIIVKLPFRAPKDPIIEATTEAILADGGDPFYEYSVPKAIVKFKQGFGRLIRNNKDRGCIVCLDSRLVKKSYGAYFLRSLPACPQLFPENNGEMLLQMQKFYNKKSR